MSAPTVTRSQSDSDQIDYTPSGSAVVVGDVVVANDLIAVVPSGRAGAGIDVGELGALQNDSGPWICPKATSGGSALTLGTSVFWDATNKIVSSDASVGRLFGVVTKAAADGDATVEVRKAEDGPGPRAATVAAVATANATDLATAEALANQLKTTVNAILTNLKAAGLMA